MANKIVEYKKDRNRFGSRIVPLWIDEGGLYHNPDNHTYIGVAAKDLEVYVPTSVIKFTKESFLERQLALHQNYPFRKLKDNNIGDPSNDENLENKTIEEVTEEAENWWDNNV
ncbi:MAG: hypothetical protein QF864_15100 [SAR202 cluster bacterium]|jgi:hypothetical protein|nr:hypothetical protein [SAR202 cluster bacterium]|tara:strand:- start:154 stop:492 length:339 start_codon:yes stop_codon:yes gene_type:complete